MSRVFDPQVWAAVPFHFWSLAFFTFGSIVGSFLNVCIYRMPRGQSLVTPRSHCPHCRYSIPWHLNIPLFTWLFLPGRPPPVCAPAAKKRPREGRQGEGPGNRITGIGAMQPG